MPDTCTGALALPAAAVTIMGTRTVVTPSVQLSWPALKSEMSPLKTGAVVRVNVTSNERVSPAGMASEAGLISTR